MKNRLLKINRCHLQIRKVAIYMLRYGIIASLLLFAMTTLLSSCKTSKPAAAKTVVVYPPPPNQARIQYLTKITSSLDLGSTQSAFSKMIVGVKKPKKMVKPYGLAIRNGKIYVCDNYA